MMNDPQQTVEIKAPPIVELNKQRSCLKRSCAIGCGGMLFFILASSTLLWLATHPRAKHLDTLPTHFPVTIPIYDKDAISDISLISAKSRMRWVTIASYVPHFIVSPVMVALDSVKDETTLSGKNSWQQFTEIMKQTTADQRDIIQVTWQDMSAQPKFVVDYYKTELKKNGYTITEQTSDPGRTIFSFERKPIDGVLSLTDNTQKDGTDQLTIIVDVPPQE